MIPDPAKIRVWSARATAYDRLCHRWEIFSRLSNRLIDWLPADLRGAVLDIGAGSGLTSELLLARRPGCEAILIEPSHAMLNLARRNLAGRPAQFVAMGLDAAPLEDVGAAAALASASMHFLDLEPAFGTLARVIAPGGRVAFNFWRHHWEETADRNCMSGWHVIEHEVCVEAGLRPPPAGAPPHAKTRRELVEASRMHGFQLVAEHCDEDDSPLEFGIDFAAMDADWPAKGLAAARRQALIAAMRERAQGRAEPLVSTRFLFQRSGSAV
jgi:SAM-dependent methyltransferase